MYNVIWLSVIVKDKPRRSLLINIVSWYGWRVNLTPKGKEVGVLKERVNQLIDF